MKIYCSTNSLLHITPLPHSAPRLLSLSPLSPHPLVLRLGMFHIRRGTRGGLALAQVPCVGHPTKECVRAFLVNVTGGLGTCLVWFRSCWFRQGLWGWDWSPRLALVPWWDGGILRGLPQNSSAFSFSFPHVYLPAFTPCCNSEQPGS